MDHTAQDEREDVQKRAFTEWINQKLRQGGHDPIKDLFLDLREGAKLLLLLETLCGREFPKEKGRLRVNHMNNVSRALQVLNSQNVDLVSVSANDIVNGNAKVTLALIWSIFIHWQAQEVLQANRSIGAHSSLEKTLLAWCQDVCADYAQYVNVSNFTTAWQDGWAFNAVLHYHKPEMFNFGNLANLDEEERLEHAFEVAHTSFKVGKLLDPEDMAIPDRKAVVMYTVCLYQRLHSLAPAGAKIEKMATLESYGTLLEEALAHLLEAEAELEEAAQPSVGDDVNTVQRMYRDHGTWMRGMRSHTDRTVDILRKARLFLRRPPIKLGVQEVLDLDSQIKIVNEKLDVVRDRITNRQTILYETLMHLQQQRLIQLRSWLTQQEDALSTIAQPGPDYASTAQQIEVLTKLQLDIHEKQDLVDSLSEMIINVEDPDFDDLRDQLMATGERYLMFTQLVERSGVKLHQMHAVLNLMIFEEEFFSAFFRENETLLTDLEDTEDDAEAVNGVQKIADSLDKENARLTQLCRQVQMTAEKQDKGSVALAELTKKCDAIVTRWDALIERVDHLAREVASRNKEKNQHWRRKLQLYKLKKEVVRDFQVDPGEASRGEKRKIDHKLSRKSSFSELTRDVSLALIRINRIETLVGITEEGTKVGSFWDSMGAKEQLRKLIEAEKIVKSNRLELTVNEARLALEQHLEDQVESESCDALRKKSDELERRWMAAKRVLEAYRERAEAQIEVEALGEDIDLVVKDIDSKRRFIDECDDLIVDDDTDARARDEANIKRQLQSCQSRLSRASELKELVQQLARRDTQLQDRSPLLSKHPRLKQYLGIIQEWHDTHLELEELERQLQSSLISRPPPKMVDSVSVVENWITNVHRTLLGDSIALTSLDIMKEQINKYTDIEASVSNEETNLHDLNNAAEDLMRAEQQQPWANSFEQKLSTMNKCWHNVTNILAGRIRTLTKHVDNLTQFLEKVDQTNSWIDGVGDCIGQRNKRLSMIDLDRLETLLEKAQEIQSSMESYQPNLDSVNFSAQELMKQAEPQLAGELRKKILAVNLRWDKLLADTVRDICDLKDAIHSSDSLTEEVRSLYRWTEDFEKETFPSTPMELAVDVQARIKHLQAQRDTKRAKDRVLEKVKRQCREMVEAGRVDDHHVEDLKEDLDVVEVTWRELDARIDALEGGLKEALPKLTQFRNLIVIETEWLNKLEKQLEKPPQRAVDADEASALLNGLELLMKIRSPERKEEIRGIRDELLNLEVMPDDVGTEADRVLSRNVALCTRANDVAEFLKEWIKEAKDTDEKILSLKNIIGKTEEVLKEDVSKADMEHEWEDMTRVRDQIDMLVKRSQEYITDGRDDSGKKMAERLEILIKKRTVLVEKLRAGLIPADFEDALTKMESWFRETEASRKLLALSSHIPAEIRGKQEECRKIRSALERMKPDVQAMIKDGKTYALFNEDPTTANQRLDELEKRFHSLEEKVSSSGEILTEALELSENFESLYTFLTPWLDSVRLDIFEPEYVEKIQNELESRKDQFSKLFESANRLNALSEPGLASLKRMIKPVREKFSQVERMFALERCPETLTILDSFNTRRTEVKKWLEGAELYFEAKEDYVASPAGEKRLKHLLMEISEYNEVLRKLREEAEKLMGADDRYTLTIQPQASELSERWNAVLDKLQRKAGALDSVFEQLANRIEAVERKMCGVCLFQRGKDVLEECANVSEDFAENLAALSVGIEDLDRRVADVSIFRDRWFQLCERWSQCKKQIESTQVKIGAAREKWMHFDSHVSRNEDDVGRLISQIEQACANLSKGPGDDTLNVAVLVGESVNAVKKEAQELQDLGIPSSTIRERLQRLNQTWAEAQNRIAELRNLRRRSCSDEVRGGDAQRYSTTRRLGNVFSVSTSTFAEYTEEISSLRYNLTSLERMLGDDNFSEFGTAQEELLRTIEESIEALKVAIDQIKLEHKVVRAANAEETKKLSSAVDELSDLWSKLRSYFNRVNERWSRAKESSQSFNPLYERFAHWLNAMDIHIEESTVNGLLQLAQLKNRVPNYESQVAEHLPIYDRTRRVGRSLKAQLVGGGRATLTSKLDSMEEQWKSLLVKLQKSRTNEKALETGEQLRDDILQLRVWFMDAEAVLAVDPPPNDIQQGFEKLKNVKRCENEMILKRACFLGVLLSSAPQKIDVDSLSDKFSDLCLQLADFREKLESYLRRLETLMMQIRNQEKKLNESFLNVECLVAGNLLGRSNSLVSREAPKRGQDPSRMSLRTPRTSTMKGWKGLTRLARSFRNSPKTELGTSQSSFSDSLTMSASPEYLDEHVMIEHHRKMRQLQKDVQRLEEVFPLLPECKTEFNRCVSAWRKLCAYAARCGPPYALLVVRQFRSEHGDDLPHIEGSMKLSELSDRVQGIRMWAVREKTRLENLEVDDGDEVSIQQAHGKCKKILSDIPTRRRSMRHLNAALEHFCERAEKSSEELRDALLALRRRAADLQTDLDGLEYETIQRRRQLNKLMAKGGSSLGERMEDLQQWLSRMENRLEQTTTVEEETLDVLEIRLRDHQVMNAEVGLRRASVESISRAGRQLGSTHKTNQEAHRGSLPQKYHGHLKSPRDIKTIIKSINHRFQALCSSMRKRNVELLSAFTSPAKLERAAKLFAEWLCVAEATLAVIEDDASQLQSGADGNKQLLERLEALKQEIDSRKDLRSTITDRTQSLGREAYASSEDFLRIKTSVDEVNARWNEFRLRVASLRTRLETGANHGQQLSLTLRELIERVDEKGTELGTRAQIGGDVAAVISQFDSHRSFRVQLDDERPLIESSLLAGRNFLKQEGNVGIASPKQEKPRITDQKGEEEATDRAIVGSVENIDESELSASLEGAVAELTEKWSLLVARTEEKNELLKDILNKMQALQSVLDDLGGLLQAAENVKQNWPNIQNCSRYQLEQLIVDLKDFRNSVASVQKTVDNANAAAAAVKSCGVVLSQQNISRLEDLNCRWRMLQLKLEARGRELEHALQDLGVSQQMFLKASVDPPWERAVSGNKVPYYINHRAGTTHWEHPKMLDMMNDLHSYNTARFAAYRTAMKVRYLQRELALDSVPMDVAISAFEKHGLRAQNDKVIGVLEMVQCLTTLFERSKREDTEQGPIARCVDLCLNFLLNLYDAATRIGHIRVLSFKVCIILLCKAKLDDKFKYLFRLVADVDGYANERKLGLLVHECIQVPRLLGEIAAFGGSNIEPSVRSCFESAGPGRRDVDCEMFLSWALKEPQSLVWLPVMQRLAAAEAATHQARCYVCKQFPIRGFRYRCLQCFNIDLCQKCFFAGRKEKGHKPSHPLKEYFAESTSGENVRDFTIIMKNKLKLKSSSKKSPRLGYLPVRTVLEGLDLISPALPPPPLRRPTDGRTRMDREANGLADFGSTPNSTTESVFDDEHRLIDAYCTAMNGNSTKLITNGSPSMRPDSPPISLTTTVAVSAAGESLAPPASAHKEPVGPQALPRYPDPAAKVAQLSAEQMDELDTLIRDLQEENRQLQAEYDRLQDVCA